MQRMSLAAVGLVVIVTVVGCSSVREADQIGEGQLQLSPQAADGFARHQAAHGTGYFAVSRDGRAWGAYGCPSWADRCWGTQSAAKAIEYCERSSAGVPCFTFSIDHHIVWRGYDAAAEPAESEQSAAPPVPSASTDETRVSFGELPAGSDVRFLAIYWEDVYGALIGHIALSRQASGPIAIDLPDGGSCTGAYSLQGRQGTWSIGCDNGKAASGSLTALGAGRGSEGRGRDTEGNRLEFRVTERQG